MEQKSSGFCDTCRMPRGEKPEQIRTVPLLSEGWEAGIFLRSRQKYFWQLNKLFRSQRESYYFGDILGD